MYWWNTSYFPLLFTNDETDQSYVLISLTFYSRGDSTTTYNVKTDRLPTQQDSRASQAGGVLKYLREGDKRKAGGRN